MAEKRVTNKVLIFIAASVVVLLMLIIFSNKSQKYTPIRELPTYKDDSKPQDGDTQADTIKALQAYAKEAVSKAERLNNKTKEQSNKVLENQNKVKRLENESREFKEAAEKLSSYTQSLENKLKDIDGKLTDLKDQQKQKNTQFDENGIPIGFGFDHLSTKQRQEQGSWKNPIDREIEDDNKKGKKSNFIGLLSPPGKKTTPTKNPPAHEKTEEKINPAYTIPKDTVLYDAIAMTALVGRIPIEGTTPDPYPVKIFVGKENLAANGHHLPDVEGMIFSGFGIGDWNLACVSVRLMSATYIFDDGSVVNHSSTSTPLGYISDTQGWPCISGEPHTNAPQFLRQRIALAGIGTAGTAYANAQTETERNALTGNTTSTVTGAIDKLVFGSVIRSSTDEISQWLLDRQKQSFDAVIVNPGAPVSIHIDKTLAIDHSNLARKVRYKRDHQIDNYSLD